MRRRALLMGVSTPKPVDPDLIHHFPLNNVSGLNDIIGGAVITPVSNRINWDSVEGAYLFTEPAGNNAGTISGLNLGVTNGINMNNLSIVFNVIPKTYDADYLGFFYNNQIGYSTTRIAGSGATLLAGNSGILVQTFDGSNKYRYLNGNLFATNSNPIANSTNNTTLYIGTNSGSSAGSFFLKSIKIWSRCLTAAEVVGL